MISFTKMQAQGNDFVIIDARTQVLPPISEAVVCQVTDRRLGIGCDQLLILHSDEQADARLRIFNTDGSEAKNCGNGLRCVGALLLQASKKMMCHVALDDRTVCIERGEIGIRVHMGQAVILEQQTVYLDVDMGNLHRVYFETPVDFPDDRNIEIISGEIFAGKAGEHVYIDIIERGVGPTLACGSGACAVAAAVWTTEKHTNPLNIHMSGGTVLVSGQMDQLILEGTVCKVFEGHYTFH